jgi:hypothetical protein
LYTSTITIRVIKSRRIGWVGHVARMEEMRNAYRISVGERKRQCGIPRRRQSKILMNLEEI